MGITKATEEDIFDLNELVHTCYRGEDSFKGWTTEASLLDGTRTNPQQLKQDIASTDITVLKYTDEQGNLIGCISAKKQNDKMATGMLCVRPDLQAQGLGRKLMLAVEDLARQNDCKIVKIDVISARESLIAWYTRLGFQKVGETKPFREIAPKIEFGTPKRHLEFILMEKQLS